jgi:predicted nucleic acid-binding protein
VRNHELILSRLNSPGEVADFFRQKRVQKGDSVTILAEGTKILNRTALFTLVLIALVYYFDIKKKKQEADKILENVFSGMPVEEIEKQVEKEYGISIEIKEQDDEERKFWQQAALQSMAKEYDDEPDYSDIQLMEPNPEYKPWKKDQ